VSWELVYTKQARKDAKKIAKSGLKEEAQFLLDLVEEDPLKEPPPVKPLIGDLVGAYSRRIIKSVKKSRLLK
jgi:Txe/YoeB family toxin of Txe-Axe toxin-antitoxin module